jgi:hypothetical protein
MLRLGQMFRNPLLGAPQVAEMKELVETIAKALVDEPDQVQVRVIEGEEVTVLQLPVPPVISG